VVDIETGPIDFVLMEFPEGADAGGVAAELAAVLDSGVVSLFDIAVVARDSDGSVRSVDLGSLDVLAALAPFTGASSGLFGYEDIAEAGASLEPGTAGLLLAYENTWARPFVTAARAAGGDLVAGSRIPAQDLLDVLDAVEGSA
jgi:hypothetical protein